MSYPNQPWGPIHYRPDNMTCVPEAGGWNCAEKCITHQDCFFAWSNYARSVKCWWFTDDILISQLVGNDPNATNVRLTGFKYTNHLSWGGPINYDAAAFLIEQNKVYIVDKDLARDTTPTTRSLPFNISLGALTGYLKFGLYQYAQSGIGSWIDQHIWDYEVWGLYDTSTAPTPRTCTVNVYDVLKAEPVGGATCTLKSGETIIATAKTNAQGVAVLNGYNRQYQLLVYAQGYTPYPFSMTVDLAAGNAAQDVPLTYVGGFELPWWWWLPIVAVVAIGGTWILVKGLKPSRREPPVYVVRR